MDSTNPVDDTKPEETGSDGEMEMNIEGTPEEQEKLLAVWNFLCEFKFDDPGVVYLVIIRLSNVIQLNGRALNNEEAQEAMMEYLKFLFLKGRQLMMGKDPDYVLPSPKLDLVWREHMLFTIKYRELCNGIKKALNLKEDDVIFGREHPKWIDQEEYSQRYQTMYQEYTNVFGAPPVSWWPARLEGDESVAGFYDRFIWCPTPWYKEGNFLDESDKGTTHEAKPLVLTEAGKSLVAKSACRKLSGQEVADILDAWELPEGFAKLYQEESQRPMSLISEYMHEYKKFWWIAYFTNMSVPSKEVDMIWHLHISSTKNYDRETRKLFGSYADHTPGGGRKEEKEGFAKTTDLLHTALAENFEGGLNERAWPSGPTAVGPLAVYAWRPRKDL
mmetsp:Transcript_47009/g.54188  ORF Transcript_47009/g.54188 Transcript_47009/m.54188 type:complete len:388 (+) Transcript_47009:80-1243(+)